mgnify:FL=1
MSTQISDFSTASSSDFASPASTSAHRALDKRSTPIDPLIESSLEYRELRRMYLYEKSQSEEWRKDYRVVKKQLDKLKGGLDHFPN